MLLAGWLRQEKYIFSQLWRLGRSAWSKCQDGQFLMKVFLACRQPHYLGLLWGNWSYQSRVPPLWPWLTLITSLESPSPIQLYWGSGLQQMNLGGHIQSLPWNFYHIKLPLCVNISILKSTLKFSVNWGSGFPRPKYVLLLIFFFLIYER